ncbi:MAG: tetratricopeptide repeat protein [Candidatus Eisenbacteria bacterium]|nr:tetratricopeptide repeat protein [Candidatus Eisenbacteria bacterium]
MHEREGKPVRVASIAATTGLAAALLLTAAAEQATESFDRAARLELAGEYEQARDLYERVAREAPQGPHAPLAAYAAGNLRYLQLDDIEGAAAAYAGLVADYPQSPYAAEAARRRGECLVALERWSEAAEAYGQALALGGAAQADVSPEWINEVSLAAADCYYELGDRGRVIEVYEQALSAAPAPPVAAALRLRLAHCHESEGEAPAAAREYARILREHPHAPAFDEAIAKRALIEPHCSLDWAPLEAYAQTSRDFRARDFSGALERCEQVLAESENEALRTCARYRQILAETVVRGDFTTGAQRLADLLERLDDPRALPNAEQRLAGLRRVAGLEAEARADSADAGVLTALGGAYLHAGAVARAIEVLERGRAEAPEEADLLRLLGTAYSLAGRREEAREAFDRYLTQNPDDTQALNRVGYACLQSGDPESALTYFERYVELAPEEANAHDSYGEGLMNAGRLEEAVAQYERAVELDPSFYNAWYMLGDLYARLGRSSDSVAAYRRALDLSPADPRSAAAEAVLSGAEAEGASATGGTTR